MKEKYKFTLFLLLPSIYVVIAAIILFNPLVHHTITERIKIIPANLFIAIIVLIIYIIPIVGFIFFIKYKPCNAKVLPFGFLLTPIACFLFEAFSNSFFRYWGTVSVTLIFTIPFLTAAIIIVKMLNKSENKREILLLQKKK